MTPDPLVLAHAAAPPTPAAKDPSFIAGLDLGQAQDYSALCVVERSEAPAEGGAARHAYAVRHLHRWPLGTEYTRVVEDVGELLAREPLPGSPLVVDNTGVGRAVVDLFRKARLRCRLVPVTVTGGHALTAGDGGGWNVPKHDLVAVLQTLVQSGRFRIAPGLHHAQTLARELLHFRVKVKPGTGNETFEAWRERDHDDLVLAVAFACWFGQRGLKRFRLMA